MGTAAGAPVSVDGAPELQARPAAPLWAWGLLVAAVCAVSSAGVVFAKLSEVPPITLAAWRLQLTSVLLGIGAAFEWRRMPPADRRRTAAEGGLLAASGVCLAFHFGLWVYSVQATSLAHSLLFVSATPLFLAGGAWALRRPISRGELAGTGVGAAGAVLLATAAARSDAQVTVRGDMAALAASLMFVGYLTIGRRLRAWMPVMVYAFCVTGLAAALLSLGALAFEGAALRAAGARGVLGWAASARFAPSVLYLAVGPGIVGHTGFNTLLRYLDPLIISLACNLEPLIGSLLGWAAGVVAPPGLWTYVGGALIMASTAAVSLAAHAREKAAAGRAAAAAAIQGIMSGDDEEGGALGGQGAELLRLVGGGGGGDGAPSDGPWNGAGSVRQAAGGGGRQAGAQRQPAAGAAAPPGGRAGGGGDGGGQRGEPGAARSQASPGHADL